MNIDGSITYTWGGLNINGKRPLPAEVDIQELTTKKIRIGEPAYELPESEGKAGEVIVADGVGGTNWEAAEIADPVDVEEVITKKIVIGLPAYQLPEQKGEAGEVMVQQGDGSVLWEQTESAGNALLENLLYDPLNGGLGADPLTIVTSSMSFNSWLINPPIVGVSDRYGIVTGDGFQANPPHEWNPPNMQGTTFIWFEVTLPSFTNPQEARLFLRLWGLVGGRIEGDEISDTSGPTDEVFCWIQEQKYAEPEGDDYGPQLKSKNVSFLQKLSPTTTKPWGYNPNPLFASIQRYEVNIDPLRWSGLSVRIGLSFENGGPVPFPEAKNVIPPGASLSSMELFSQFPGSGTIATLPGDINHQSLANVGVLDHATIDSYLDQGVKTTDNVVFNDAELKSVEIENWKISQQGGDLLLEDGEYKAALGGHVPNTPTTFCIWSNFNSDIAGGFRNYRSRGSLSAPGACQDGDITDVHRVYVHNGSDYANAASYRFRALGNQTTGNSGSYMDIELHPQGSVGRPTAYYEFRTDAFNLGLPASGYALPTTRGYPGQVLKLGEDGQTVDWDTVGKYSQITEVTAVNTVVRTLLTPASAMAKGSLLIPANVLKVGDSMHIRISGIIDTAESKNEEVDLNLTSTSTAGEVILHETTFIDLNEIKEGPYPFEWEVDLVVKEITGATSSIYCNSQFSYTTKLEANAGKIWNANSEVSTLNLTLDQTLGLWAQWNNANPSNLIRMKMCTMTKTF